MNGDNKRGQISIEYLVILGFITFALISIMSISYYYSYSVQDKIRMNHIINFGNEVVRNSESVYYAGKPSQITITPYLPSGVKGIWMYGRDIIFNITTTSGFTQLSFTSNVNMTGSISSSEGIKKLVIRAQDNDVLIGTS